MTIDWSHFTPWAALLGGAIIGLSATLLVLMNGRIAGISGILGGLFKSSGEEARWRIAFISGLLVSALAYTVFAPMPEVTIDAGYPLLVVAGLIVGIGTRYGSGCTSGHGVCGLSRLSPRSLVATLAFMGAGFVTVFIVRHVLAA
jgi:uncharacterized membrane protein YedE/YeeE